MRRRLKFLGAACGLTLLPAVPVQAQLNGSHSLGDFGVQAGTQPQPGFYAALFYLRTDTDTILVLFERRERMLTATPSACRRTLLGAST